MILSAVQKLMAGILSRLTEDVLKRLHQMSSESLAANGESIRHKVLFIASSLLNKYPAQDSAGHEHVADFLKGELDYASSTGLVC